MAAIQDPDDNGVMHTAPPFFTPFIETLNDLQILALMRSRMMRGDNATHICDNFIERKLRRLNLLHDASEGNDWTMELSQQFLRIRNMIVSIYSMSERHEIKYLTKRLYDNRIYQSGF